MTKPIFSKEQISSEQIWKLAVQWVSDNKKLIRQIAGPYLRYMAADTGDLLQEATIAAFKALKVVTEKEKQQQLAPFFRVIFKTNCIKLASGIQTVSCELHHLPDIANNFNEPDTEDHEALDQAFIVMTKRQREVCSWILNQSHPVSTPALAREFNISRRHACRLISGTIERIEMVHR